MDHEVVYLKEHKRPEADTAPIVNEVAFPKVYRLTGYKIALTEGDECTFAIQSDQPMPVAYTFANDTTRTIAKPHWELLEKLDPSVDKGWLIVRHHDDMDKLTGYLDAMLDMSISETSNCGDVYDDEQGFFSLTLRMAPPGAPDSLLIHVRKYFMFESESPMAEISGADVYTIFHPDGTVTQDPDILYPFFNFKK